MVLALKLTLVVAICAVAAFAAGSYMALAGVLVP